jgi:hypothetical protein
MSMMHSSDSDFRICRIGFDGLVEIQSAAERQGWGTRWTSINALRSQVKEEDVLLQTLMREERDGVVRSYRCLVLFSLVGAAVAGGVATIDLEPARLELLARLDRDPDVRAALVRMFSLATGGTTMVSKG